MSARQASIAKANTTHTLTPIKAANYQSNGPVTDVSSSAIRCYELSPGTASQTYTVNAGDTVGFTAASSISHPGPLQFYMAKVPSGQTAATFDGSGNVWFKVYSQGATFSGGQMTWASNGKSQVTFTLPKSLPTGEYLVRVEHIGLHSAGSAGGAQFYISCAQIKVENGGSGSPGPLVSFPGAYKASDPGIQINIYYPVPTSYTPPGPAVWSG
jgi:plastocyanin